MRIFFGLILIVFLFPIAAEAQLVNGLIDKYEQEINVFKEDSIIVKSTITGHFLAKASNAINLEDHPDAKIYTISVTIDHGENGKGDFVLKDFRRAPKYNQKGFESLQIVGLPVKSHFEEREVTVKVSQLVNSTKFIKLFDFGSEVQANSYSYTIKIPAGLSLSYQIHGDSTFFENFQLKTKEKAISTEFVFEASYPTEFFTVNGCIPRYIPQLKVFIHPEGFDLDQRRELAAQIILERAKMYEPLNDSIVQTCFNRFGAQGGPTEKARSVFKYLSSRYKRADLMNDLVYFPIRDVNFLNEVDEWSILELSSFYCRLMRSFGLESSIGIAHSLIDPMDLDFYNPYIPQHFISILKHGETVIQGDFNTGNFYVNMPSEAVQGKKIFKVDEQLNEIVYNPVITKEENISYTTTELWEEKGKLQGTSRIVYNGLSRTNLTDLLQRSRKEISHMILEPVFAGDGDNIVYSEYKFESEGDSLVLFAKLSADRLLIDRGEKKFIYPEFNIFPHSLADRIKGCTEMRFISSFAQLNAFETIVHFKDDIKLNQSYRMELEEDGIKFHYNVDQIDKNTLRYRYYFKLDKLFLNSTDISKYNSFNSKFGRYMYTPMLVYIQK